MGRQAHHHFIPRTYLKGFTLGGKDTSSFWCVPANDEKSFPTTPKDACSKRDYYTVDHQNPLIVENWYATEIEPKIGMTLQEIQRNQELPNGDDLANLILLLATLYLRNPAHRSRIESPMKRAQEIVESMSRDIKVSNKQDFEFTQTDLIAAELRQIDIVIDCLKNKYYQLHIVKSDDFDVITCDDPFMLSHPRGRKGFYFGLNTPEVEICVPISRKAILLARNEPFEEGTFLANEKMVGLTNTKLILSTQRFFFTSTEEISLVNGDFNVYRHQITSNQSA
jgi:hypothetical protein